MIKKDIISSNTTPTESTTAAAGADTTASPIMGDILLETNSRNAHPTVVPQFLTIAQKKSKASVHSYLTSSQDVHFQKLLNAYIAFKSAAVTSGVVSSFSTSKQPSHISWWIRCACTDTPPSWSNPHDYGSSVITWWTSLQLSWRKLECSTTSRKEGSFECLFQPGINGLLNVVILAYWWSNGLTKPGTDSKTEYLRYHWFVADVTWVLSKLFEATRSN